MVSVVGKMYDPIFVVWSRVWRGQVWTWEYAVPSTDPFGEPILRRTSHISIILTHFPKVLSLYLLRKHPTSHFLAWVFRGQPEQSPRLPISWPSGWRGA